MAGWLVSQQAVATGVAAVVVFFYILVAVVFVLVVIALVAVALAVVFAVVAALVVPEQMHRDRYNHTGAVDRSGERDNTAAFEGTQEGGWCEVRGNGEGRSGGSRVFLHDAGENATRL